MLTLLLQQALVADQIPLAKTRIQRAIIATLQDGPYYKVTYSEGVPDFVRLDSEHDPSSVRCNEIQGSFSEDKKYGRARVLTKDAWSFEALVYFDREVTGEVVEDLLRNANEAGTFGLPAQDGKPAVVIDLKGVTYRHPTTSPESNSGTQIRFTFSATPLRR